MNKYTYGMVTHAKVILLRVIKISVPKGLDDKDIGSHMDLMAVLMLLTLNIF